MSHKHDWKGILFSYNMSASVKNNIVNMQLDAAKLNKEQLNVKKCRTHFFTMILI